MSNSRECDLVLHDNGNLSFSFLGTFPEDKANDLVERMNYLFLKAGNSQFVAEAHLNEETNETH